MADADSTRSPPSGYSHEAYAHALAEFGRPRPLPASGGHVLERTIEGVDLRDAMGCYPLFSCPHWERLGEDLDALRPHLVSVTLVTDPFGAYDQQGLEALFPDRCVPFKEHVVVDVGLAAGDGWSSHHRRNVRRVSQSLEVDFPDPNEEVLAEWTKLYGVLIERHGITGMARFSVESFRRQFATPGLFVARARIGSETVGMTLWYADGNVAYYHLGAYTQEGYEQRASFAMFPRVFSKLSEQGLAWLDLGAGAGADGDASDGLTRFKRGWSKHTRTAWLCGRVFDLVRYEDLARKTGTEGSPWFPAYRSGEFS